DVASEAVTLTVLFANEAPEILAVSGTDANEGETAELRLAATDHDGHALSYTWTQVTAEGEDALVGAFAGTVDAGGNAVTTFTAPEVQEDVALTFIVTVRDSLGEETVSDPVTVTIRNVNQAPTVSISPATITIAE